MPLKDMEARHAFDRERTQRKWGENPEKMREYARNYQRRRFAADPGLLARVSEYVRQRRAVDPEPQRAAVRRYEMKHRDKRRADARVRAKANPGRMAAKNIRRRFREEKRTPSWADMDAINMIYLACPEGMTVDHIVPLLGKTIEGYQVDGLHVPWNLGYLTHSENSGKGNRMRPEDGITAPLPA